MAKNPRANLDFFQEKQYVPVAQTGGFDEHAKREGLSEMAQRSIFNKQEADRTNTRGYITSAGRTDLRQPAGVKAEARTLAKTMRQPASAPAGGTAPAPSTGVQMAATKSGPAFNPLDTTANRRRTGLKI